MRPLYFSTRVKAYRMYLVYASMAKPHALPPTPTHAPTGKLETQQPTRGASLASWHTTPRPHARHDRPTSTTTTHGHCVTHLLVVHTHTGHASTHERLRRSTRENIVVKLPAPIVASRVFSKPSDHCQSIFTPHAWSSTLQGPYACRAAQLKLGCGPAASGDALRAHRAPRLVEDSCCESPTVR